MRILAVDTSGAFGSVAIWEDGITLEEVPLHSPEGFGQILFGHIQRIIERNDWPIESIDCFAAASGPGSFTGVRIGLSTVKGLAEATGRQAMGVSTLQALASMGSQARRGVMIDARRDEVYAAIYDSSLRAVSPEVVASAAVWLKALEELPDEIISSDLAHFRTVLPADIPAREYRWLAAAISDVCYQQLSSGASADPLLLDANYVRKSDAELHWREG